MRAISRAPSSMGTASASIWSVTPEASAISQEWPMSEKPVTSVQAWRTMSPPTRPTVSFRRIMESVATRTPASSSRPPLYAVVMTPVPRALVSTRASPTLAPALARSPSSWTKPVTERPYLGSWSLMEWPPATTQPASWQRSAPPARICPATSMPRQLGKHSRLSASLGSPPMA